MGKKADLVIAIVCIGFGFIGLLSMQIYRYSRYGISRRFYTKDSYESNGERIYYTATNNSGEKIDFNGGPPWLYTMGGSCVSCHGVNGKGGIPVMMTSVVAPDIRYQSLTSGEHVQGNEHEESEIYTDELIKKAITEGIDASGNQLNWAMPRWKMSEGQLNDLLEYLQRLNSQD